MAFGDVTSREFKVMLDETMFGSRGDLMARAGAFWADLERQAEQTDIARLKHGPEFDPPRERKVEFIDTTDGKIYLADFALRRRREPAKEETKITLKKRHADWVLALHNGISQNEAERHNHSGELVPKFEEDVKPFDDGKQRSLFSHSLTWEFEDDESVPGIDSVGRVDHLYPGFEDAVDVGKAALTPVGALMIDELLIRTDRIRFAHDRDVEVEAAVVAWYDRDQEGPGVVEFSYRYGRPHVEGADAANDAVALLRLLQTMEWHSAVGPTKTSWIYQKAGILQDGR